MISIARNPRDDGFSQNIPKFAPGQVVIHRRYAYRGVVVAVDNHCRAGEQWYQGNMTQPNRDQPWCHVLVHGSGHTTYVAQQNLLADASGEQIEHPLTPHFFSGFIDGRYVRNGRPWPNA